MKALVWLGCIFVYSLITNLFRSADIMLGALPTMLLAVLLIFIPAPLICKALGERNAHMSASQKQSADEDIDLDE